ncbi:945_t:CDS:10 [Entrophospora sp. SA101]|nr:945_t:CDS:10 [Entrophospora sp. SA101]
MYRWGTNKKEYYDAEELSDLDEAKEEEKEVLRLQKMRISKMTEADFFDDDDDNLKFINIEVMKERYANLPKSDIIKSLENQSPELIKLLNEFKEKLSIINESTRPIIDNFQEENDDEINSENENNKYYEEELLENNSSDLDNSKPSSSSPKLTPTILTSVVENEFESTDFGDLDVLDEVDAEDKIQRKKSLRYHVSKIDQTRKVEKKLQYNQQKEENKIVSYEDDTLPNGTKRKINYQIYKNKGLMPHRKKEQRNPRVKHRNKYVKAKKKIKSIKPGVIKQKGFYGGESTGINAGISRSVRYSKVVMDFGSDEEFFQPAKKYNPSKKSPLSSTCSSKNHAETEFNNNDDDERKSVISQTQLLQESTKSHSENVEIISTTNDINTNTIISTSASAILKKLLEKRKNKKDLSLSRKQNIPLQKKDAPLKNSPGFNYQNKSELSCLTISEPQILVLIRNETFSTIDIVDHKNMLPITTNASVNNGLQELKISGEDQTVSSTVTTSAAVIVTITANATTATTNISPTGNHISLLDKRKANDDVDQEENFTSLPIDVPGVEKRKKMEHSNESETLPKLTKRPRIDKKSNDKNSFAGTEITWLSKAKVCPYCDKKWACKTDNVKNRIAHMKRCGKKLKISPADMVTIVREVKEQMNFKIVSRPIKKLVDPNKNKKQNGKQMMAYDLNTTPILPPNKAIKRSNRLAKKSFLSKPSITEFTKYLPPSPSLTESNKSKIGEHFKMIMEERPKSHKRNYTLWQIQAFGGEDCPLTINDYYIDSVKKVYADFEFDIAPNQKQKIL